MDFKQIQNAINMASYIALDNYRARNAIIDRFNDEYEANGEPRRCNRIKGECNYYLPITDSNGNKLDEVKVDCDVIPVINSSYRYIFRLNGTKIARKNLAKEIMTLMS